MSIPAVFMAAVFIAAVFMAPTFTFPLKRNPGACRCRV
jgi:hypothetical protein